MKTQKSANKHQTTGKASVKYRSRKGRDYVYTPGSLWSHLSYGLGTLLVILMPALIPGFSDQWLIMGYMGALVALLIGICVWGMVRSLIPAQMHRSLRYSRE